MRRALALLALVVAAVAPVRPASAAPCELSLIRVLPEGLAPADPEVVRVRDALRDRRFSSGATTVEIGPGERADAVIAVSLREAWGERFLLLERREGPVAAASQALPLTGAGTGDVQVALRSLLPCANAAPAVRLARQPEGRLSRGQPVTLDACGSTDPDGDTLSYNWEPVAEPGRDAAVVNLAEPRRCRLEGLRLPADGVHRFRVAVSDGTATSSRVVEVVVGSRPGLRWRQAEGGAVGQPVRLDLHLVEEGGPPLPAGDARCEVLAAPGRVLPAAAARPGSCSFETPLPGWYRVRVVARSPAGDPLTALAEVWVGPRTPVPVRGERTTAALLTLVGNLDGEFSLLLRGGSAPRALAGVRAGVRFLLLGQAGAGWYPGGGGLDASSLSVGVDVLGFTRLLDPYRRFGPAPRQFGLGFGVEHWEQRDPATDAWSGVDAPYVEGRVEVLYGLHLAARLVPEAAGAPLVTVQAGLSVDELVGWLARLARRR